MDSPGEPSFPSGLLSGGASPSGDEGFFPFVLERRDSFLGGGPGPEEPEDLALQLQQKEKDLLLAAELGKMLLERNEELRRQLETLNTQHLEHEEASRTEQELQRELDTLRERCQTQALAGAELGARLESLQAENQMLQDRRQDLEAQIRGLREEVDKGQNRLQTTHEELLLLRRERKEHKLEITLHRTELQTLRDELQRQKELRAQDNPEEALSSALSDRDEAVNKAMKLSLELSRVSLERDSLSRELLRAIRQKVALTQELEAWQDDMQVVIGQQLRSQRQKELSEAAAAPRRAKTRFSLRLGSGQSGGFLSNLFRRT